MPITETQLPYAAMQQSVHDGVYCTECGELLSLAWGGKEYGCYILRCSDLTHKTMTSRRPQTEYEKEQEKAYRECRKLDSKSLTLMTKNEMMERVNSVKFPKDLNQQEKQLLTQVAIAYGLDPLMKEVSIFQGSAYVSIDGRYRAAQETGLLAGVETRPATLVEKEAWDVPEGDYFFRAEVYRKDSPRPFVGWGRVFAKETVGSDFLPTVRNPQRMAEKRAEAQALRKAFHIPLPSSEDIGNPNHDVDISTGEIIESTATEVKAKPCPDVAAVAVKETPTDDILPNGLNYTVLKDTLSTLKFKGVGSYLEEHYKVTGTTVREAVAKLNAVQVEEFTKMLADRQGVKA